jgi:hypothetical protein
MIEFFTKSIVRFMLYTEKQLAHVFVVNIVLYDRLQAIRKVSIKQENVIICATCYDSLNFKLKNVQQINLFSINFQKAVKIF